MLGRLLNTLLDSLLSDKGEEVNEVKETAGTTATVRYVSQHTFEVSVVRLS